MIFSLFLLCVLAASTASAREDVALDALTARLASAAAKASAVQRALSGGGAEAASTGAASILGRKRDGDEAAGNSSSSLCADGRDEVDTDKDGHPDCVDACPADFRKTRPGACGCGERDTDSDLDGHADCVDACPLDAAKHVGGLCGCGAVDSGCGCNVAPVNAASASCAHVAGTRRVTAHEGATFDLFGRDGGLAARLVLPAGALEMRADEHIVLQLADGGAAALATGAAAADALVHGAALTIGIAQDPASRAAARERTSNGYALDRAATVCLAPASELVVRGLCLGFFDVKSASLKCFEPSLAYDAASKLACARVPLLTTVQLVRASRFTTIEPYVSSVEPRVVPADGRAAVRIVGGNFERGVLTRVLVDGAPLDVAQCETTARAVVCSGVPAGRGAHKSLELQFTSHAAQDMLFTVKLADALDYAAPQIHAVELVGERVHVTGEHFGPAGALHKSAVLVDGEACVDARVEVADQLLSCTAPASVVALQKRSVAAGAAEHHKRKHTVAVRLHERDEQVVQSTPAHWIHACRGDTFRCQDGTCAAPGHLCPACNSGWSACPLARPVLVGGHCVSLREHEAHPASEFDVTVDGSATVAFAIGAEGRFSVQGAHGPDALKHCASVGTPAHADGFASAVFNISVAHDYRGHARIAARSHEIAEAQDAYGFCFARWNCDADRWECVDESLELELAPAGFVAGDVPVHAGNNLYAIIRDNCPNDANPSQRDSDADGVGDACESTGEVAESCRDRSQGNVKYIQKIRQNTHSSVDPQPCPYGAPKRLPVCDPNEQIFDKIASSWAGPRRPLPLKAPYEASEKRTPPKKP